MQFRALLFILELLIVSIIQQTSSTLLFEAVALEWEWPNSTIRDKYVQNGDFVPEVCMLSGIQTGVNGEIFVTVPRIFSRKGVPSGLNTLVLGGFGTSNGRMRPYPDLESNKLGDCSALQLPLSAAMDPRHGHLYVIDAGRVSVWSPKEQPLNLCPAKIVVFDTRANGKVVRRHDLPEDVVSSTSNILNDIMLDYVDPDHPTEVKYAYISDPGSEQLVVYDFTTNTTWSFKDPSMMPDKDRNVTIKGESFSFAIGIDGLAMSPSFNYLYYSAVGSKKLWQIPTWVLRRPGGDFTGNARVVGTKKSNSDALVAGHKGVYYGALEIDAVYRWELEKDIVEQGVSEGEVTLQTETVLAQNWETMQWPDGLAFGNTDGDTNFLYVTPNRAQLFFSGLVDITGAKGANIRVFKFPVSDTSYLTKMPGLPHAGVIG